jgi:23S rRNA-/tRNA-specific pseudouridylate synthase
MALLGTPVVGDKLYGHGDAFYKAFLSGEADLSALRAPRQALHAWRLSFWDEGVAHAVTAPLPGMFEDLMGAPLVVAGDL